MSSFIESIENNPVSQPNRSTHVTEPDLFSCLPVFLFQDVPQDQLDLSEHLLMEPGDVLKLRCDAGRRGSVLWYKGDARVQHSTRIHIRAGVMEIIDISFEDSGVYVCVLRGSREMLRNLTITVAGMVDIFTLHSHTPYTILD